MTKFAKFMALALVVAVLFGFANVPAATAQGEYVKTFDLKLPLAEGEYKGVDVKGTKVVWWHQHSGRREEALKKMIESFNANNPFGITVDVISKGSYDDIFNAVTAGIQTNELPEITVAYGNQAAVYQNNQALVDIETFFKDPMLGIQDFEKDMFVNFFRSDLNAAHNNARLGFSMYRSMESLYINPAALAELGMMSAPTTWADFRKAACDFTNKDKANNIGFLVRTDASFMAAIAFAQGMNIYDAGKMAFTYNNKAVAETLQLFQDMVKEGCAGKIAERFQDQNFFAQSKALFYVGSSSGIPFVATAIRDAEKAGGKSFMFDIAPIPGYGNGKPTQNVYGASNSIVAKGKTPAQILSSWLVLRWFAETAPQAEWAEKSNYFPVRLSAANGLGPVFEAELTGKPYKSAFDLLGNTMEEPSVDVYQTVRSEASKAFNDILDGANVEERLTALDQTANKLLEESMKK